MGEIGAEDLPMNLTQFFQGIGSQLQEFLWRDTAKQQALEEIDSLQRGIRAHETALARQELLAERLQRQVHEHEEQAQWLASRVELYLHVSDRPKAWQHALELDQVRSRLNRQRQHLLKRLQSYSCQKAQLEDLRQQLAEHQSEAYAWT
jgi:hypothetical protein